MFRFIWFFFVDVSSPSVVVQVSSKCPSDEWGEP